MLGGHSGLGWAGSLKRFLFFTCRRFLPSSLRCGEVSGVGLYGMIKRLFGRKNLALTER